VSSPFEDLLSTLIRQRGVLGWLVVGERDGIIVDSNVQVGVPEAVVAALAAGIHASAGQLGRELDGKPFRELYHAGRERHVFIGEVRTAREAFIFLTAFGDESSLGLVRVFFGALSDRLATVVPPRADGTPLAAASLEQDLARSLAALFGRAPEPAAGDDPTHPTA
jgi:predicted regulator of Ras-like GTPase activity (Roadblock/LC7/MglB family)